MPDDMLDQGLRLVGLFFVNFANYVHALETGILKCVSDGSSLSLAATQSITAAMGADDLRRQFFAATALVREHSPEETKIRKELNRRGQDLTERRNHLAHGAWFTGTLSGGADKTIEPSELSLHRITATKEGPQNRVVVDSHEELRSLAEEANLVAMFFLDYTLGLFYEEARGFPSIMDRLGFEDGRLTRLDLSGWTPPTAPA